MLEPVAVDREIVGETTGLAAPLHLSDERDRRDSVLQARVRQLWKAGPQHRGPRLVCDNDWPTAAVPLQGLRRNSQHEHGDSVPRSALLAKGIRPGREPARRGREHFRDRPGHRPFPQHHRAMARAGLASGRALQPADVTGFRHPGATGLMSSARSSAASAEPCGCLRPSRCVPVCGPAACSAAAPIETPRPLSTTSSSGGASWDAH